MADEAQLYELERRIGYLFLDRELLREALTHRALSPDRHGHSWRHNQRLAFLGDSVLKLVLSQTLMERASDEIAGRAATRGEMTDWRKADENELRCAELAGALGLGPCLVPLDGYSMIDRASASVLEQAFEAVIGAIFQDCGFDHARRVVAQIYSRYSTIAGPG